MDQRSEEGLLPCGAALQQGFDRGAGGFSARRRCPNQAERRAVVDAGAAAKEQRAPLLELRRPGAGAGQAGARPVGPNLKRSPAPLICLAMNAFFKIAAAMMGMAGPGLFTEMLLDRPNCM